MKLVDLKDNIPKFHRIYFVCIRQAFGFKTREAYAEWSDNGFILVDTVLFNDEYIFGFYLE
ncbi:hypothetical protein SAMN05428642_101383 [Flaviramulus basaltis]|uniref:Uncharacterized protein n=1 Tax=Flaviramulus basaltis TaxID=369401 RepID=A0A1K2IB94_9FLAO|nr:hypothetical protein [Flaviramulus basaltis]SFZ89546.1 hypothetical protein SAMN05428642_101383 [Flaviramulus basaltis]